MLAEWELRIRRVFPVAVPRRAEWKSLSAIRTVLKHLSGPNLNYSFLPSGGGLEILATTTSHEQGCVELIHPSGPNVVKPTRLMFESFGSHLEWAYLRLETSSLEPASPGLDDLVLELSPGRYVPSFHWDEGEYQGRPLPKTARLVNREHQGGPWLIVGKGSRLNDTHDQVYDAAVRWEDDSRTANEFRAFVAKWKKTKGEL